MHQVTEDWISYFALSGINDILIGNAKYGTGYTLSPMAEFRILTDDNAYDHFNSIKQGLVSGTTALYNYKVSTGSFATTGLTKYTAQPES